MSEELTVEALSGLKNEASEALDSARSAESLEEWRITYLGRKGKLPLLLRSVKDLSDDQKREVGPAANSLRQELEALYEQVKQDLLSGERQGDLEVEDWKSNIGPGHLHPLSQTTERIQAIFTQYGFTQVEGPLVEDPFYDFDALNIPPEHPARAETDTFYTTSENVLRTSTSAVQVRSVREMNLKPPFKLFSPGRVFRSEKIDPTHSHTFHQVEALAVGKDITIADYIGFTQALFSEFFGTDVTVRLRPGYFPFVEPGFEPDISCVFCGGSGCRVCKNTGWIEVGGAGMVHPVVLQNMEIDPAEAQGFAFGYGLERLTMLRHGIDDIRLFMSGDLNFLRQF